MRLQEGRDQAISFFFVFPGYVQAIVRNRRTALELLGHEQFDQTVTGIEQGLNSQSVVVDAVAIDDGHNAKPPHMSQHAQFIRWRCCNRNRRMNEHDHAVDVADPCWQRLSLQCRGILIASTIELDVMLFVYTPVFEFPSKNTKEDAAAYRPGKAFCDSISIIFGLS